MWQIRTLEVSWFKSDSKRISGQQPQMSPESLKTIYFFHWGQFWGIVGSICKLWEEPRLWVLGLINRMTLFSQVYDS